MYACLQHDIPWVAPVGRLDQASEGLLLLTNDSEWSARVLAPETHLDKTCDVQIAAVAQAELLESIRKNCQDARRGGDFLRVKSVSVLRGGERNTWLEIVLDEGKNRHIRRMLAEFGIEVSRLIRISIGPLSLGNLPKGSCRPPERERYSLLDRTTNRTGIVHKS